MNPKLSIVIPVGPGDEAWRALVPLLHPLAENSEILISACTNPPADGPTWLDRAGSPVRWLSSEPGRARQLNYGLQQSQGDMLWLLHADSRPDAKVIEAVTTRLEQSEDRWFYFSLAYAKDDAGHLIGPARLNAAGANLRCSIFGLPFGDQGWLLSRTLFDRVGLFDASWSRGEDLEWVLRARRLDIHPEPVRQRLHTSARSYAKHGWLRTTLDHQYQTIRMIRAARRQHQALK